MKERRNDSFEKEYSFTLPANSPTCHNAMSTLVDYYIRVSDMTTLKEYSSTLPTDSPAAYKAISILVDYYIRVSDMKTLKEYSSTLATDSPAYHKAISTLVDYYIRVSDMKTLKEYSSTLATDSPASHKAISTLVDYYIRISDMKTLKEYSSTLRVDSPVYHKAISALADYSIKAGEIRTLKEYSSPLQMDSPACHKSISVAVSARTNSEAEQLKHFSNNNHLFFLASTSASIKESTEFKHFPAPVAIPALAKQEEIIGVDLKNNNHLPESAKEIPPRFICPITQDIMEQPVMAEDGHSYEKENLKAWLAKNPTSPITREPMSPQIMIPNRALKDEIQEYINSQDMSTVNSTGIRNQNQITG